MDALNPRQFEIVKIAQDEGRVNVEDLAERFGVTPQTIRKDLNELCDRNVLQRYHGGALLSSGVENLGYESRVNIAECEKQAIGSKAAELIPDSCSLIINIGTTTERVASALRGHKGMLVITNNINVANILRHADGVEVIITAGSLRKADGGIVGSATYDFIKQFKVDYAIMGASAIDGDGALLDYDYREVRVSQAILESSRNIILVADSMKFERTAPVRIGHISQVDTFVTDKTPSPEFIQICQDNNVQIVCVEGSKEE